MAAVEPERDRILTWLWAARRINGLTQRELAKEAGVSHVQVSRYENGRRQPRLATAIRIAEVLDLPVQAIFPDADAPQPLDVLAEHLATASQTKHSKKRKK